MKQASRSEKRHIVDRQTRENCSRSHMYHGRRHDSWRRSGKHSKNKIGSANFFNKLWDSSKKVTKQRNHRQKILSELLRKLTFNPQDES